MTPEAQRIAIAEACGWVYVGSDSCTRWYLSPKDAPLFSADPKPWREIDTHRRQLPDFLNDLNAMHEAFMAIIAPSPHYRTEYGAHLQQITHLDCVGIVPDWERDLRTLAMISNATADKKAETFLRALNLWTV